MTFITQFLSSIIPWIRQLLFGSAIKSAGKGALKKSPFNFHAPNLFVTALVICGVNAINFLVMLFQGKHHRR